MIPEPDAVPHSHTLVDEFHVRTCPLEQPPSKRSPSDETCIPETDDVAVVVADANVISIAKVEVAATPEPFVTIIPLPLPAVAT